MIANVTGKTGPAFLAAMKRIRTAFYRRNDRIDRPHLRANCWPSWTAGLKKKDCSSSQRRSPERVETSGSRLSETAARHDPQIPRRVQKHNRSRGSKFILGVSNRGKIEEPPREARAGTVRCVRSYETSGTGFRHPRGNVWHRIRGCTCNVLSGLVHVIELKMLKGKDIPGPAQLATYMNHKRRREGWLVFFDARKTVLSSRIQQSVWSDKNGHHKRHQPCTT